ncbi:MAG: tRNA (N(6)-L-threonylcarbamoyladenosine(37)-C(2))-methylthiotransferase MtaB [Pseudomonadota bacterium]
MSAKPEKGPELITFGCRLNSYESEVMAAHAKTAGMDDVVIVNTCAVTTEAVRQARQSIRKLRRDKPDAQIIVTGCAAQIDANEFAQMPEVNHVIGNDEKMKAETFARLSQGLGERVQVNDIMSVRETASHIIDGFGSRARAYVQIQNGCDHRCTFCIIPYGRGNSRSVPAGDVITQIRKLVDNGYREIVLTGVDMTSYGPDLPGQLTLGKLVQKILMHIPDLDRLRLSSIDSIEVDAPLMDAISSEARIMPHLHLSLQAGDNMILKRMKRRHLREDSIAFCSEVRKKRSDIVFGADLIAGFPTETDDMFENTLALVDECELTYLHVFPFSPRPGTPAARMPQLERQVIKQRAARLRQKADDVKTCYHKKIAGSEVELLMEKPDIGRTPHFSQVKLNPKFQPGHLVKARITGYDNSGLTGVALS